MADRLTRTERAAIELALGVLRRVPGGGAYPALVGRWSLDAAHAVVEVLAHVEHRCTAARVIAATLGQLVTIRDDLHLTRDAEMISRARLLRVRLALCLRVLLRADRGDLGRWRAGRYDARRGEYDVTRRIRPLWQVAGETRREAER